MQYTHSCKIHIDTYKPELQSNLVSTWDSTCLLLDSKYSLLCPYLMYSTENNTGIVNTFWAARRRPYIVFTFTGSVRNVQNDVNIICQQHGGREVGTNLSAMFR